MAKLYPKLVSQEKRLILQAHGRIIVVDVLAMRMWLSNARAVLGIALQSADDVRSETNLNIRTPSAGYDETTLISGPIPFPRLSSMPVR